MCYITALFITLSKAFLRWLWSGKMFYGRLLYIFLLSWKLGWGRLSLCFHASPQCLRIFFRVCTVCIAHCIVVVSGQASHMDLLRNLVIYPWDDFTSCNVKEILLYVFFICGGDKEGLKFEFLFLRCFWILTCIDVVQFLPFLVCLLQRLLCHLSQLSMFLFCYEERNWIICKLFEYLLFFANSLMGMWLL